MLPLGDDQMRPPTINALQKMMWFIAIESIPIALTTIAKPFINKKRVRSQLFPSETSPTISSNSDRDSDPDSSPVLSFSLDR